MRVAGWLALIWGVASVALAIATDLDWADLAGGYGLGLAFTGAWTVLGVELLNRHQQRVSRARAVNRITTNQQGAVSH